MVPIDWFTLLHAALITQGIARLLAEHLVLGRKMEAFPLNLLFIDSEALTAIVLRGHLRVDLTELFPEL